MLLRDWVLGILTVLVWGGAFTWYFFPDLRRKWRKRDEKWFREPF